MLPPSCIAETPAGNPLTPVSSPLFAIPVAARVVCVISAIAEPTQTVSVELAAPTEQLGATTSI